MDNESYIKYIKENIIYGNYEYWILKKEEEVTIYDKKKELYKYDEFHDEFLSSLSSITDKLDDIESEFKKYYKNAGLPDYNYNEAAKHIAHINSLLQKMHIFFTKSYNSLFYIRRVLYVYFRKMVQDRFICYLRKYVKDDATICMADLETFRQKDRDFLNALLLPVGKSFPDKTDKDVKSELKHIWYYFLYDHNNKLNTETKENVLKHYHDNQDYINVIHNTSSNFHVLPYLIEISNIFTDYFSIFSHLLDYYPNTKIFHQYMLILSNNCFIHFMDSCKFYSTHESMYNIISYYIAQAKPNHIRLAPIGKYLTENIYQQIKDSIDTNNATKEEIRKILFYYYPKELEKYIGVEIIKFHFFEQLLVIELLDIIAKNKIIKKCPYCEKYFITKSKAQKYCDLHKNKHYIQQRKYSQQKSSKSQYQSIFNKFNDCFYQRKIRKRISENKYKNWKKDAQKIMNDSNFHNDSEEEFTNKLVSACRKYNIDLPRKYKRGGGVR